MPEDHYGLDRTPYLMGFANVGNDVGMAMQAISTSIVPPQGWRLALLNFTLWDVTLLIVLWVRKPLKAAKLTGGFLNLFLLFPFWYSPQ